MLDTTKDIFWLIAAGSLGLFTIFICWAIYYVVMMLRNANKMVSSVREKIELLDSILHLVKEKLERTSTHLSVISESVLKVAGFFMDRQKHASDEDGDEEEEKKKKRKK